MNTFQDIVGNERVIQNLRNAIKSQKVSHAYLISGGEGMGKKLLANVFAKALECEDTQNKPCGNCVSCHVFDSGNHPDVFYIRPTKTKALGIEDIREQIIENVPIKPYRYRYKVYIIDKADTMTVQAQNALLKTLEEPPHYGVFLLLASNIEAFLPTILSRCIQIKMREVPLKCITAKLEAEGTLPEKSLVYAEYAKGSIGKALKLIQSEEFSAMREEIIYYLIQIEKMDMVSVMNLAKQLDKYKDNPEMLDIFYMWYRDLLTYQSTQQEKYFIQRDKSEILITQAKKESFSSLCQKIDAVFLTKRQLQQNANFQLAIELMLMKLKES